MANPTPPADAGAATAVKDSEDRISVVGRDITAVLQIDLCEYADRELQRRFLLDPTRAAQITDDQLATMRAEAVSLADAMQTQIGERLSDPQLWLQMADGDAEIPTGKDLRHIAPAWAVVSEVEQQFEEFAQRYGLSDERQPVGYQPPRRFVRRLYLPTLVETCLRELDLLRGARRKASVQDQAAKRATLSERWNAAAPKE